MRIVGIDPGLATVGIGIIEAHSVHNIEVLEWMTIETMPGLSLAERLLEIEKDLSEVIQEFEPEMAVVEKLYFETNVKTAIDVSQARGVILLTLAKHGVEIIEATPLQLKSTITGDGKADKRQVQDMLKMMLKLHEIPKPDDAADALALAVYGALSRQTANVL